jgi:hypothetical protein
LSAAQRHGPRYRAPSADAACAGRQQASRQGGSTAHAPVIAGHSPTLRGAKAPRQRVAASGLRTGVEPRNTPRGVRPPHFAGK